jgi:hypothetical protein
MNLFKNSFDRAFEKACKESSALSKKPLEELCNWISLQKEGSSSHLLGMYELQRRQNHKTLVMSRVAIIVSVISALALMFNSVMSHLFNK